MIKFLIGVAILILSIWIIIYFGSKNNNLWLVAPTVGCIAFFTSLGIILYSIITPLEFKQFEKKFEIQKAQYEMIGPKLDGVLSVMDIIEANEELAEYQASKEFWSWWSSVPDRVMDITPIGS